MATHIVDQKRGTVQTTDATQTNVLTYALLDASVYSITAYVTARDSSGNCKMFHRAICAKRSGGGATLVGNVMSLVADQGEAASTAWACTVDVSGNDVRVRVTGQAATTIDWLGRVVVDGVVP
jgi:hypothetical protein